MCDAGRGKWVACKKVESDAGPVWIDVHGEPYSGFNIACLSQGNEKDEWGQATFERDFIAEFGREPTPQFPVDKSRLSTRAVVLAPYDEVWKKVVVESAYLSTCRVRTVASGQRFEVPCARLAPLPPSPGYSAWVGQYVLARSEPGSDDIWEAFRVEGIPTTGINVVDVKGRARHLEIRDVVTFSPLDR